MKKFIERDFYVVKYMFNFDDDMSERDFYRIFDSIKNRDWELFNKLRKEFEEGNIEFEGKVWVLWDKVDEEYEGFELNEETFKLINYVHEFYNDFWDFIY